MSGIRSQNTKPEVAVRKWLHHLGYRFRLHRKDLPGKPDIVLPRHRLAIFVHGCFWHQHKSCKLASIPKTRQDYWLPKLAGNAARDAAASEKLQEQGWAVATIWECETRQPHLLDASVKSAISLRRASGDL